MVKTFMLANQKGGVGKTTASLELGFKFALKGKKVLLIDLDSQHNLTKCCLFEDLDERRNIYKALNGDADIDECIKAARPVDMEWVKSHLEGSKLKMAETTQNDIVLDILPGSRKTLAQYFTAEDDKFLLRAVIQGAADYKDYDYAIIDCGPGAGSLMTMAMVAADYIIAVVNLNILAYEGFEQLIKDYLSCEDHIKGFKAKLLGILFSEVKNTTVGHINEDKFVLLGGEVGALPFEHSISGSCIADECKEYKLALTEYLPDSKQSIQYKNLADEIEERICALEA